MTCHMLPTCCDMQLRDMQSGTLSVHAFLYKLKIRSNDMFEM
jgi:hypothetical protein